MEISINEKIPEKLLKRERINFLVEFDGPTPSIVDIRKAIAQKLGIDMKILIVRRIYNEFGITRAKGYGFIYDSIEEMLKTEPEFVRKKNKVDEDNIQEKEEKKVEKKEEKVIEEDKGKQKEDKDNGKEEAKE